MAFQTITVECPCCKADLVVDSETGSVLSHKEFKKERASLEDFIANQKNRTAELDAKFKAAKEKEKNHLSVIEKKFEAAKKNKDLKDPPPSVNWD